MSVAKQYGQDCDSRCLPPRESDVVDVVGAGLFGVAGSPTAHHFFGQRFLHPGPAGLLRYLGWKLEVS